MRRAGGSGTAVAGWVLAAVAVVGCAPVAIVPRSPGSLPAYVHNDYRHGRPPLGEALARGYAGVEADVFLVDGELRLGHDRGEAATGPTLEAVYLAPLRRLVAAEAAVRPDGRPFLLNVEAKEADRATFAALLRLLLAYGDILVRVEGGREIPGPVQVVLVGHHPPLAALAELPVRPFAVQSYWRDLPADHAAVPAHLLRLVTVQYRDHFAWTGAGAPPPGFSARLAELAAVRDAVPGRLLRVIGAPHVGSVQAALVAGGADLIGTRRPGPDAASLAAARKK